ncbi:hypothetical protein D0A34_23615 [Microcoleus vaginatus PCC 9802]|uniref:hypothetical protein n=1 Tax=Microcoleus vaginatus TaxID=119532 RepID=UPI00020D10A9|nr:hypothetical protein MicvaDRAFT_1762 [Microcoleus vaginatus FGP-2]UNU21434.1 hypothetical protein D0A34_23615 [Microcoleus vaginatus PCC 9802]
MQILDNQTSSAYFNGTADKSWIDKLGDLFNSVTAFIGDVIGNIQIGDVKLGDWYAADPVGAAAGVTLGGVIVYLGGQVVVGGYQSLSSLVTACRSLGVLGSLRAAGMAAGQGVLAAGRAIGGRALYLLGHPGALVSSLLTGVTVGAVMRWCAGKAMQLINFNWNQTDEALEKRIASAQAQLWSVAGGSLGSLLGTALCGIAPGASIVRVNPSKLAAIKEVNQELYEEAIPQVRNLINATIRVGTTAAFVQIFKNARKFLKSLSPAIKRVPFVGETIASWLEKWGAPDAKPWSINIGVKAVIQTISDKNIQEFFEELWEEFLESCQEGVFVLSTAFG